MATNVKRAAPIRVSEKVDKDIQELSQFSGIPKTRLLDWAWQYFQGSREYAKIKLFKPQ